ncbi:MAG: tetratricopeptide repeat protein [Desulfobacterales bacterium]|jgi:tetratricopeptide (TPR) repeat protein|nr:tetratricopeptide repeat protein [Desulfobacterales bacterium]
MKHNDSLNEAFERGMDAFVNDDFSESVEEFTKAIEIDPDFALTYVSRGAALMKMHRIEESILDFNRAIELNPEYPKTYHLRGLARVEVEDHEGAMEDFGNAIDLDPDYGQAYYNRAALQIKLGREDLATEDLQMVNVFVEMNTQAFANENNIWRSQHLRLEEMGVADPMDR